MASERKIAANRRNARKSTGPRSAAGKARTRGNAWKHGLAAIHLDHPQTPEIERLAIAIVGTSASSNQLALARPVAETLLELQRVRCARLVLMNKMLVGLARRSDAWP